VTDRNVMLLCSLHGCAVLMHNRKCCQSLNLMFQFSQFLHATITQRQSRKARL